MPRELLEPVEEHVRRVERVEHRRELGHRDGHRGTDAAQICEPPTAVAPASRRRRIWSYELHEASSESSSTVRVSPASREHLGQRVGAQTRAQERQQVMRGHSREVTISDVVGSHHVVNIGRSRPKLRSGLVGGPVGSWTDRPSERARSRVRPPPDSSSGAGAGHADGTGPYRRSTTQPHMMPSAAPPITSTTRWTPYTIRARPTMVASA